MDSNIEGFNNVKVVNIAGQVIANENMNGNQIVLDVSYLDNGVYFIELNGNRSKLVKKLLVQ